MKTDRKIIIAVNHVRMEHEDRLDVLFWLNKSISERLAEVSRLRKNYFTSSNRDFPEKIEKVVHHRLI